MTDKIVNEIVNKDEFIALIKRYETITLDEIKETFESEGASPLKTSYIVKQKLTGFGSSSTCTLCKAVKDSNIRDRLTCRNCIYFESTKSELSTWCIVGENRETYDRIYYAGTVTQLKNAYLDRAKRMREVLSYQMIKGKI